MSRNLKCFLIAFIFITLVGIVFVIKLPICNTYGPMTEIKRCNCIGVFIKGGRGEYIGGPYGIDYCFGLPISRSPTPQEYSGSDYSLWK